MFLLPLALIWVKGIAIQKLGVACDCSPEAISKPSGVDLLPLTLLSTSMDQATIEVCPESPSVSIQIS